MKKNIQTQAKSKALLLPLTQARVNLGHVGSAIPTAAHLKFQMDHAMARDAVYWQWETREFAAQLKRWKFLQLSTQVADREEYLKRPDLGRQLSLESQKRLKQIKIKHDVAIVISNGLSSLAVQMHAIALLRQLIPALERDHYKIAPLIILPQARVAISDQVGVLLHAKIVIMVIGERPGLSSPDSLAVYLTYHPKSGNTDEKRNCISNIRPPHGLGYLLAAQKTHHLVTEAFRLNYSGVNLKDNFNPQRTLKEKPQK